jgi:UDP-N-acetylmuramoylalanine--D-glutamate ligase
MKTIGVWGLGIVGKSAIRYFAQQGFALELFDQRMLSPEECKFLADYSVRQCPQSELIEFLERNDRILPSAGIDLRPFSQYKLKWLSELDLFAQECKKPIIAITGSVGKTTVTHLLSEVIKASGKSVFTGGNIGVGLLDSIRHANDADYVVLEVSSFQLELCKTFAPAYALWTNLYPNHLDRHSDFHTYFLAKSKLICHSNTKAFVPLSIKQEIDTLQLKHPLSWLSVTEIESATLAALPATDTLYYLQDTTLIAYTHERSSAIEQLGCVPELSYPDNILLITILAHQLGIPASTVITTLEQQELPEHRLEHVADSKGLQFYNDSKATIPASTLAALEKFKGKPILLFVGGVSKGVNRADFIKQLHGKVQTVVCFGKEAETLHSWCIDSAISSVACKTIDEAFSQAIKQAQPGTIILFSPAGASFDLFANYQERGNCFKKLVKEFATLDA